MKAMVFAAGLGTRLKPLTDTMPKALVPVCGQPLLYHVLTKLVAGGFDDIVVNVHHFPDQIIGYLAAHDFGARISVSDERDFLRETGGGIRFARPFLAGPEAGGLSGNLCHPRHHKREGPTCGRGREATIPGEPPCLRATPEPFLVHNVDIVSNLDFKWLRERHRADALATLVVSERKTQRYFLFDEEGRLKGWTNLATGEVRSPFPDIDPEKCRKLAFAGIHLLSPAIFDAFDRFGPGERFPIVDFYLKACAAYPIYAAVPPDLELVDVGKIDTLPEAEAVCARLLGAAPNQRQQNQTHE